MQAYLGRSFAEKALAVEWWDGDDRLGCNAAVHGLAIQSTTRPLLVKILYQVFFPDSLLPEDAAVE